MAAWARALPRAQAGRARTAAVLAIDRGVYFQLAPQHRTTLVNMVTRVSGYIVLFRDLIKTSMENARALIKQLRGP